MDFDYSTETITPDNTNILTIGGTGALELPFGLTTERPVSAIAGALRWNTNTTSIEFFDSSIWKSLTGVITAGNSGITVNYTGSSAEIFNAGVLSFSTGTTGLSPITSTTGAVTLSGTLNIGAGGTNATTAPTAFNNLSPLTTAGDTLYYSGTTNTRLPIGTTTQVMSVVSGLPSWISQSTMSVGNATLAETATNIAGGTAGSVPYQTSANTTSFLSIGSTNNVLTVVGGVPTWQTVSTALGYTPVNKAGDTMLGTLSMGGFGITNLLAPVNSNDAATKAYVDATAVGISVKDPVMAATTSNLTATYVDGTTDANGGLGIGATLTNSGTQAALVIDGYTTVTNDRVLIKNQTNQVHNGIYVVTSVGSGSTNWVLTRASDYNDSILDQVKPGNYVLILNGTVNGNEGWINTSTANPVIIGTDDIVWTQFSSAVAYSAGTGLSLSNNTFSNTGVLSITTSSGLSTNTSAAGNVSITNTGVTSIVAGTGISISSGTGAVTISSTTLTSQNVTSAYTVLSTDGSIYADASTGSFTVSLPASPVDGELHNVKKVDQTRIAVIISGNGNNIDNYSSITINIPYTNMTLQWNAFASSWQIL